MDKAIKEATYARILQNMIEEAEENIEGLEASFAGYEHLEHLDERRAQLREAMALVATLDPERYKAPEERTFLGTPVKIDPSLAPDELRIEYAESDVIRIVAIGRLESKP
jgi:hypothetical protein